MTIKIYYNNIGWMGKTKSQKNIEYLQALRRGIPGANGERIEDIIKLYRGKQIKNVRTAANVIKLLSSRHHMQKQKAIDSYNGIMEKFDEEQLKKLGIKGEYVVNVGNHDNPRSHITFDVEDKHKPPHEMDRRTFDDIYHVVRKRMKEKVKEAVLKYKNMKMRFRLHFVIMKNMLIPKAKKL